MEWGIRVSALPEKAGGSAGNGQQQKVAEGSHQRLPTLGRILRRFARDCISVQKLRRRSPASSQIIRPEQNYPRKAPALDMMRDIFVIHDESMLPVKRPQDAGNGLPRVMFFFATHATCRTAGARRLHAHRLSAAADRTCGTRHHCLESATADAILPSIDLPLLRRPPAAKKPTEVGFAVGAD